MALINCSECGKEISDKAVSCPYCGCPLSETNHRRRPATTAKKKKGRGNRLAGVLKIVLLLALVFAITICVFKFGPVVKMELQYQKAVALYNDQKYKEAIPALEELSEYRDSRDILTWSKYYLGVEAMKAHNWSSAVEYFTNLKYGESAEMLTDCSFMVALEQSVTRRMEANQRESTDFRTLCATESAYLEPYRTGNYFDNNIKTQALKYFYGLNKQSYSLDKTNKKEAQIAWQEGMIKRYEALCELNKCYGFMKDNPDFIGTYVNQLTAHKNTLAGFRAIDEDLLSQYRKDTSHYVSFSWDNSKLTLNLKNNTIHTFSATWEFKFTDENKRLIATVPVTVSDIKPFEEYTVNVYARQTAWNQVSWEHYFEEVI